MPDLRRKRAEVLGMHEDGESVEDIAHVCGLTKTQVELILIAWGPRGTE